MKHCASTTCPFVRKHGAPSEFRDEVTACADCGGPLIEGAAPDLHAGGPSATASAHAAPWGALVVTLAVLATPWMLPLVPLPGVDEEVVSRLVSGLLSRPPDIGAFALGVAPILYAFFLVEVAALAVPAWRPLRHGGVAGRARLLRATMLLTLVLAFVQGFAHAMQLEAIDVVSGGGLSFRLLVATTLTAGTFVYVVIAQLADRYALASGYSLLAGATIIHELVGSGERLADKVAQKDVDRLPFLLLATAAVVVATAWLLSRRRAPGELRVPACGIAPLGEASALFALPATLASFGLRSVEGIYPSFATYTVAVVVLAVLFTWLMNRPARIAAFAGPGIDVSRPLLRAAAQSIAFVTALAALPWVVPVGTGWRMPSVITLAGAVAVALDVAAHWRARRALGDLVPLWPEHRVYAVDAALAALGRAGITGHARGVHHRVLWQFFGPQLPIVLYAPKDQVAEAERVLARVLGGEGPSPGAPYRASA